MFQKWIETSSFPWLSLLDELAGWEINSVFIRMRSPHRISLYSPNACWYYKEGSDILDIISVKQKTFIVVVYLRERVYPGESFCEPKILVCIPNLRYKVKRNIHYKGFTLFFFRVQFFLPQLWYFLSDKVCFVLHQRTRWRKRFLYLIAIFSALDAALTSKLFEFQTRLHLTQSRIKEPCVGFERERERDML